MNWVDLAIILVVLLFAIEGQKRGFLVQLFDILGFLTSLAVALTFYETAAAFFTRYFNLPAIVANAIGFLVLWLITEAIFFSAFVGIFTKIFSHSASKHINKLFGFIPAVLNALLFLAFVLLFIVSLPINPQIKQDIFDSRAGAALIEKATILEKPFNKIFGPITRRGLTFFTITDNERDCQPIGFTQTEVTIDSKSEKEMFEMINRERQKAGSRPLVWSEGLAEVGRNHSKDMMARNYFCHFSPEGLDVGNRLENAGIEYSTAGENLAFAPDVTRAHSGLINSLGHRRNILDPAFGKIGIGAVDGGIYGKMFTQVFTN